MNKKIVALLMSLVMITGCISAFADTTAQEKVYVVLDASGEVKSITDIVHLENADGLDEIQDRTMLTGIESLEGPDTFAQEGDNLIWQAGGRDVIYQGTSDKAPAVLPVITATVDGEAVPVEEVKNLTGDVVITVSYQAAESMPALAVTAILLPEEGVTGLTTENALVLREMGQQILVGWGVPGVNEALKLPASFTVSFRGDHANLKWAMTVVTSDPLAMACREIDERIGVDLNAELANAEKALTALKNNEPLPSASDPKVNMLVIMLNQLNDSLVKLDDSARELADGAKTLSDGAAELKTGADQINEGAAALKTGAASLSDSMETAAAGAAGLQTGLETLTKDNEALCSGADRIFNGMLDAANAQLAAAGLDKAGVTLPKLTADNYAAILDKAEAALNKLGTPETKAVAKQVKALKDQLDLIAQYAAGVKAYTEGAAQAAEGAKSLNDGMSQLKEGAAELKNGAAELAEGTSRAADGAKELSDGASTLQTGAQQLQASGTQALKTSVLGAETMAANLLLPYVQNTLPEILTVYDQTRDQLANPGYDIHGDDIVTKTIYIMRTDFQ